MLCSIQFHDILGGTCISSAYRDASDRHGRAIQTAAEHMHYALQSITNMIAMPGKNPDNAWNLAVWNLNGFPIDAPIEAEVQWAWEFPWYNGGITLTTPTAQIIPRRSLPRNALFRRSVLALYSVRKFRRADISVSLFGKPKKRGFFSPL